MKTDEEIIPKDLTPDDLTPLTTGSRQKSTRRLNLNLLSAHLNGIATQTMD